MLKLPELPQIKLLRTVMPDDYRYGHVHGYTHKDMKAYGRACADAALEAAEIERLRADAERYRWLRGGPDVPPESNRWARWEVRHWCGRWWNTLFAEALDAAIDAARKGTT